MLGSIPILFEAVISAYLRVPSGLNRFNRFLENKTFGIALDQNRHDAKLLECTTIDRGAVCSRFAYTAGAVRAS